MISHVHAHVARSQNGPKEPSSYVDHQHLDPCICTESVFMNPTISLPISFSNHLKSNTKHKLKWIFLPNKQINSKQIQQKLEATWNHHLIIYIYISIKINICQNFCQYDPILLFSPLPPNGTVTHLNRQLWNILYLPFRDLARFCLGWLNDDGVFLSLSFWCCKLWQQKHAWTFTARWFPVTQLQKYTCQIGSFPEVGVKI